MSSKSAISLLIGGIISLVALYWALRNVPLQELYGYLRTMNYRWVAPAILVVISSFVLRVLRWQLILSAARRISFWHAFHPLMIGFMINCVLPGRVGELARPAILTRRNQIPYATGLATVVAERIFDTLTILLLLAGVLLWTPLQDNAQITYGGYQLNSDLLRVTTRGVAGLGALLLIGTAMISHDRLRRWIQDALNRVFGAAALLGPQWETRTRRWLAAPLNTVIEKTAEGLSTVKDPNKVIACLALSLGNWLLLGFSYYLVALGAPGIDLSYFDLLAVMIIICFFIALPSVPGYWGLWEAGGVFALGLFSVNLQSAAGYTLVNHAIQLLPVIVVGLVSALVTGARLGAVVPASGAMQKR